jgi:peptidyl-tRNA hydrolase, PTH1 family
VEEKIFIKAIVGLGNPGPSYYFQRHSIGFRVLDRLAEKHGLFWISKGDVKTATIPGKDGAIFLIKPQTFMNSSGVAVPALMKKGIKAENILVVHDELEKPFGSVSLKFDGSHKGHNGLKSIIGICGTAFYRIRVGIGRPVHKDAVPEYVLQPFEQSSHEVDQVIENAVDEIEKIIL